MDCVKIGALICELRKEKGLTQKELADKIFVSDKAVSKWERGIGCPDISLLQGLARELATDISDLLNGELHENRPDTGDMRKVTFYLCRQCGNVLTSTGPAVISCCGRTVPAMTAQSASPDHYLAVEQSDEELYISSEHPMTKSHSLSFIALVTDERVHLHKLYPEQMAETHFKYTRGKNRLYACCSEHGLWSQLLRLK